MKNNENSKGTNVNEKNLSINNENGEKTSKKSDQKFCKNRKNSKGGINNKSSRDNNACGRNRRGSDNGNSSRGRRDNDPSFYFLNEDLANQASSFAFDSYLGVDTPYKSEGTDAPIKVPSIFQFMLNPSAGDTSDIKTGINIAALKTYTTLSSINAKTTNYAPQDITTLLLAIGELISIMEHIRRAFGVAFTYNQRNRDIPKQLLEVMGFDSDDFLQNLAQHRLHFNSWVTAINKLPIPSNISYFYKCAQLYQHVYTDSNSAMAQVIICRPYSTWIMDEAYNDQGTGLRTTELPLIGKWAQWVNIVDSMIEALFTSTTLNYIYSDVLNLASKEHVEMLYLDYLVEGYSVVPEYNSNFLLQMHNATIIGAPTGDNKNDVTPNVNKNIVNYEPRWKLTGEALPGYRGNDIIVDLDTPEANVADRIEATRYQATLEKISSDPVIFKASALPDHYVVSMRYVLPDTVFAAAKELVTTTLRFLDTSKDHSLLMDFLPLAQYDWAPIVYITHLSETDPQYTTLLGDVNYYTTLQTEWYRRVNDLTFQALFTLR